MNGSSNNMSGNKRSFSDTNGNDANQDGGSFGNTDLTSNFLLEMMQSAANQSLMANASNSMMPFGLQSMLLMNQYMANPFLQAQLMAATSPQVPTLSLMPPPVPLSTTSMVQTNMTDGTNNFGNLSLFYQNPVSLMAFKGLDPTASMLMQQNNLSVPPLINNPMMSLMGLPQTMDIQNIPVTLMLPSPQIQNMNVAPPNQVEHVKSNQYNYDQGDDNSTNEKNSRGRIRWTQRMDDLLLQAFDMYKDCKIGMWKKVAQYVSAHLIIPNPTPEDYETCQLIVTNHQCGERYKHHLHPDIKYKKTGPWTEDEIEQLKQLVSENQVIVDGVTSLGRSKSQVNWIKVSEVLNRNYRDCQHKWTSVSKSSLKKGVFTQEEEDLILSVVEEHGDSGSTWTLLENELGRKRRSIQDKYNYLKRRKKNM